MSVSPTSRWTWGVVRNRVGQLIFMTTSLTSGQRPRTCRACGKKFDYPVKGSAATRQPSANPACNGLRREAKHAAFVRTEILDRSKTPVRPEAVSPLRSVTAVQDAGALIEHPEKFPLVAHE